MTRLCTRRRDDPRSWHAISFVVAIALVVGTAATQTSCMAWTGGQPLLGVNGAVWAATEWDPDGSGPASPRLVLGGVFTAAGGIAANRVVTVDLTTGEWEPLGTGIYAAASGGPWVRAFTTLQDGSLVVGGNFAPAGGVFAADGVARWDGTSWDRFGLGFTGYVNSLVTMPNGDLIAGGAFTVTGTTIGKIARWNGTVWSAIGTAITGEVRAMHVDAQGRLVASFRPPGSFVTTRIVRWDGSTWTALGPDMPGDVNALVALQSGELVACGSVNLGSTTGVSVLTWNGAVWSPLGGAVNWNAMAAAVLPNGDLLVASLYYGHMSSTHQGLARWNGTSWSPFSPGEFHPVYALVPLANGDVIAGGDFTATNVTSAQRVARWSNGQWVPVSGGTSGTISCLLDVPGGGVIAGGAFDHMGGTAANNIAIWSGNAWAPLGAGLPGAGLTGAVSALFRRADGTLVANASISQPGGGFVQALFSWNGSVWSPLTFPANGPVHGLVDLDNGDVVVWGNFTTIGGVAASSLARWNGSTWSPLGSGVAPIINASLLTRVMELHDGDLLAIGSFSSIGGVPQTRGIARWDGAAWHALGGGAANVVWSALELPDGDLLAIGGFMLPSGFVAGVLRWDGLAWSVVGATATPATNNGSPFAMLTLPDGDLLAAGNFTAIGGVPAAGIARFDGSVWSPIGTGCVGQVWALANAGPGNVAVGGTFVRSDGATNFVRLVSTCAATVMSIGSGCSATGSPSVYAQTAPAWLGSTWRARGSTLPDPAIAAVVTGLQMTNIPLAQLLPPSPASCSLFVVPDVVELAFVTTDVLDTALAVPDAPALLGAVLHQQLVFVELGANGAPLRSSSTNGLMVMIGAF